MISRLLQSFARRRSVAPPSPVMPALGDLSVPPGLTVFAVGDIHGQLSQAERAVRWMLDEADVRRREGGDCVLVFLGDYVDRGEGSRGVIDLLSSLPTEGPVRAVCLAGNHEATMLAFLEDPEQNRVWLDYGGRETLLSYGVFPPTETTARALQQCRDRLRAALPAHHLDFLSTLPSSYSCGSYFFVHAGVRPSVALGRQKVEDLLWIRGDFLDVPVWHGQCVVHGHTIEDAPVVSPWRIGVDTGAYAGGALTCVVLQGNTRRTVGFPQVGAPLSGP